MVPFAAQSRDEPEPYSFPAKMISGTLFVAIFHGGVVDGHLLAAGLMDGPTAFGTGREQIAQANIGERAAHHHFVIAAARAIGIEILRLHSVRDQIFSGGRIRGNGAGGRNVVGGDAIAQHRQRAQAMQILQRGGLQRHIFKIWRMLDVGGFIVPGVEIAFGNGQSAPVLVAGENVGIFFAEHFAGYGGAHGCFHFVGRRPDIAEINRLARFVVAERFVDDIEIHATGERVSDDQRRRGQIIRAAKRIDAAFESFDCRSEPRRRPDYCP